MKAVTVTNKNPKGQVAPGWYCQIDGIGRRFTQEAWEAEGVAWINEQLGKSE